MKTKKIIRYKALVAFITIVIFNVSCSDDFLNLTSPSNMNESDFYKTQADFEIGVNAAYATLYTMFRPESGISYTSEQMGDNATLYHVTGSVEQRYAFKDYNLRPDNQIVQTIWEEAFESLFRVNNIIDKIEQSDLPLEFKAQVTAEMRFLRGLYYFYLVRMFGGIPIVDRPVTVEESYDILRSDEETVYDFIIGDLQYAEETLPLKSQSAKAGKATKGAAQSVLGEVYLTLGDNTQATIYLQRVVESQEYELMPTYGELWGANVKNTNESIFEIQHLGGPNNPSSPYWSDFAPSENFSITARGGGMNQVADDLWNEYEAEDVRRDLSIFDGYENNAGVWIDIKFAKKWVDMDAVVVSQRELSNNNFVVIRYAHVLLMLAEATDDESYLNMVRDRVGLPRFGTAEYPSDQYPTLNLAIEHERRVELALEFYRWYDLKRTGRAVSVLMSKGKPVTEEKLLLPIPTNVIDQNPLIHQNAGY